MGAKRNRFRRRTKLFFEGGEVMALILDDDSLLDAADGFAGWDDALADDTLAQELEQERAVELESELEQDEHPIDYDA